MARVQFENSAKSSISMLSTINNNPVERIKNQNTEVIKEKKATGDTLELHSEITDSTNDHLNNSNALVQNESDKKSDEFYQNLGNFIKKASVNFLDEFNNNKTRGGARDQERGDFTTREITDALMIQETYRGSVHKQGRQEQNREATDSLVVNMSQNSSTSRLAGAYFKGTDPLVLDLNGEGIKFSPTKMSTFDLDADGIRDKFTQLQPGSAYLALDKNGNGKIDNGQELFGDQNGAINGFEELKKYDSNGDSIINRDDPVFEKLILTGLDGHLMKLENADVSTINLNYQSPGRSEKQFFGLELARGSYQKKNGQFLNISDYQLDIRA
ncbi:hypothetical protein ACFL35_09420 [Candidatus Riflebacteria bacterium]